MEVNKSLLCLALQRIKSKHNITSKKWSELSGVPESTLSRFLSASLNIPNFPAVCAMLKCLGESIDDFYASIDAKIDVPADALKLDTVPSHVADMQVELPEVKAEIHERIIRQTEEVQRMCATLRERETTIELLESKLEQVERLLKEKERTVDMLEDISTRRLKALQALCSAQ